jgi:hypothetical protein
MRTICCVVALLLTGATCSAQYTELAAARRDEAPKIKRFRFLSLTEGRALALDHTNLPEFRRRFYAGLGSRIEAEEPALPKHLDSVQVLTHRTSGVNGILVAGVSRTTPRPELERNANQMLLNIENAYWNLYGSYWQLHSRDQALRLALETWKIVGTNYRDGKASLADFAKAQGQYELFRGQRLQAFDTVLDNERQLRAIAGMQLEDGTRLVPCDVPTVVEKKPDWDAALAEAMKHRPELHMARADVKVAQMNLLLAKMLPVLSIFGINDFGPDDAAKLPRGGNRWGNPFHLEDPSYVRPATLRLARAYFTLQEQEMKAERFLGLYYRRMASAQGQIMAARAQREAFATQLCIRSDLYRTGKKDATLDVLLEAQRFGSDALATECQAIVTYNNAICAWEYAKGSILTHAHVTLSVDAPSSGEKKRAVVYEGRRTRSKVRHETAVTANSPLNVSSTVGLPALWKRYPPLLDAEASPTIQLTSTDKTEGPCVRLIEWKVADIFRHLP